MIKALLALAAMALGGLLYLQWSDWPPPVAVRQAPVPPGQAQPADHPDPTARLSPLEDREEYAAVKERPLFRPERRPPKDEPEVAEEAPAEEPTDLAGMDLTGVLISPKVNTAWVKEPSQPAPVRVRPGEILAGWTVKEIKADRLLLERQGKTDTLLLREFNAPGTSPPPPPPAPRPPAAARQAPPGGQQQAGAQRPRAPGRVAPPAARPPAAAPPPVAPRAAPPERPGGQTQTSGG
jgi:hypothetical protein